MFSIYQKIYYLDKEVMPNSFYDSMGTYRYYPLSNNQIKNLTLHDFHEGPWERIIWDLDVSNEEHLQFLYRNSSISFSKYTIFLTNPNKSPQINLSKCLFFEQVYRNNRPFRYCFVVYKCVEEKTGEYVDLMSIMKNYKKELRENIAIRQSNSHALPKYRYYLRHPHTTAEMRCHLSPEERREYEYQYGIHIKERAKRNNLPTYYDDNHIHYDKCWKSQTKQRSQYNRNRKAKRKRNFGEFRRDYVEF